MLEIKPTINISAININKITDEKIIKWLVTLNNHGLTYKIINGQYILYKKIKTIKKENIVFNDKCCVCLEEPNCLTECNHDMCLKCIDMLREHICPLCRQSFEVCYVKN